MLKISKITLVELRAWDAAAEKTIADGGRQKACFQM
jgi:hypothetical protein